MDLKDEYTPISIIKDMDDRTLYLKQCILEYLDSSETETSYITVEHKAQYENHTHLEIHPSLMFGIMGNQICFPQHNPCPRNVFSCSQSKQAVSMYHSNYTTRIDKMGVMLNYGQKPLVRTRYLHYLNEDQHPYGINAIVAIMCHTGYNVEDSILFNEGSIKRGLFKTTYYNMYETYEETSNDNATSEKRIKNIYDEPLVTHTKPGYNYNELDKNGIIKENTMMDEKNVLIGKISYNKETPDIVSDESIFPKKGQLGYVDKTYITENEEGRRIAKVRIRESRDPVTGDKFASRCGQKGTVGNIIPEENMPYTKDGIRPDLIINPHALPSRMTIGQFLECIFSKIGCEKGSSIDNTSFLNKGSKDKETGALLNGYGYHSSGNELLYNGLTGEQIEGEIFIGPTYYMRLKHMVKDKINYRAGGPRTLLTRQTNQGRANDGGLRIGEMERDGVIGHGMATFLQDALMKRGDEYKMVVCNHSGTIAIYNKELNNFYSPIVDGPIMYDMEANNITPNIITKYGKEFSVVKVPYCFKLLMQELTAMNVQMRLITTDNIDHLTNTGNTNLSDILKNAPINSNIPKENEELKRLEQQYKKNKVAYKSRLQVLKQKFGKLKSNIPENSYYKKELDALRVAYIHSMEEYYDLKKEVYKEDITNIERHLEELKTQYNENQQTMEKSKLEGLKRNFNKYKELYKKTTGDEYDVPIEEFEPAPESFPEILPETLPEELPALTEAEIKQNESKIVFNNKADRSKTVETPNESFQSNENSGSSESGSGESKRTSESNQSGESSESGESNIKKVKIN
jgi:hypothetical protein